MSLLFENQQISQQFQVLFKIQTLVNIIKLQINSNKTIIYLQHAYLANQSSYRTAETQIEVGSDPHLGIKVKPVPSKDRMISSEKKDDRNINPKFSQTKNEVAVIYNDNISRKSKHKDDPSNNMLYSNSDVSLMFLVYGVSIVLLFVVLVKRLCLQFLLH